MIVALSWHYRRIGALQVTILLSDWLSRSGWLVSRMDFPGNTLEQTGGSSLAELAGQQNKLVLKYVVANLEELSNVSEKLSP